MEKLLEPFLKKHGFKARVVPAERLKELESDFNAVLDRGLINRQVYKSYLKWFKFMGPEDTGDTNSIIILAMPRPMHRLWFSYKDKNTGVIIPPTYMHYRRTNRDIFKLLKKWMNSVKYSLSMARLPLKLLAVRSGLAKYGRNNIAYIEKWGSFYQLIGFYSNCISSNDPWQDIKSLDACRICTLCIESCPTGAISKERFVLDAEKCLTFLNESKGNMPTWVLPGVHNSLIGCMKCQLICPYNKDVKKWIEDIGEFDSKETEILLKSGNGKNKDLRIVKKLKDLGVYEYLNVMPRNLRLLIKDL